jgi:DNA-binding transcriptional MerR regulator
MANRGQAVYTLNIAAQLVGLSPRTLRLYEEARLLSPARSGGKRQRFYSEQDLQWLRCIRDMIHDEGLTVTAIRRLLDLVPCWQVRRCPSDVALHCAPCQNVPDMAREGMSTEGDGSHRFASAELQARPDSGLVTIKLIYGVEEMGAMIPCSRCVSAERVARKVGLKYPGRVAVAKYDLLSEEAGRYGALLVPTVLVENEIVSAGKCPNEDKLDEVVRKHLAMGDASA